MKRLGILLLLVLSIFFAYSGVDEMKQRQPVQEPTYQKDKDKSKDDDHGNGHGHGGGPNTPINSHIAFLIVLTICYGTYMIYTKDKYKKDE